MKKSKKKSVFIVITLVLLALAGYGAHDAYRLLVENISSKDGQPHSVYIYPGTSYEVLMDSVRANYDIASPLCLSEHKRLLKWDTDGDMPTGHYVLPAKLSDKAFIRLLQWRRQTPVRLSFNNIRTRAQLAGRLASQLMIDSTAIITALESREYMANYGLTPATAVCLFLPDSYEVYWNMSVDELFGRMQREYKRFWNEERLQKADSLHLKPWEVATIASIVESETNRDVDKPIIAGLYLNRLRIGMPLQSCPTVIFAGGDFTVRRVTNQMLQIDSPYNTYRNLGLPPGPIRIPTAKTLDYVLHATPSQYLYMCASTAFDGTHHFSASYAEHQRYAVMYQRELNRRHIH